MISIIVPVYNAERSLDQCVTSIVNQTYTDLEIILVDDGSTDNSGRLCDQWAQKDSRIVVIHQKNQGPAVARNAGLDRASGAYIGFVDSDDYVKPTMFERLYDNLCKEQADLSIVSYERVSADGKTYCNAVQNVRMVLDSAQAFKYINIPGYFYVVPWDKLAKKELFEGLRYPIDAKVTEDAPIAYALLDRATVIVYDSTPEYCYRTTEGSQSSGITMEYAEATANMLELVSAKYPQSVPYAAYGHLDGLVGMYNRMVLSHAQKQWKQLEQMVRDNLKTYLPVVKNLPEMTRSKYIQWRLLEYTPRGYALLYSLYKARHSQVSSH